jgi:hypothetical protein
MGFADELAGGLESFFGRIARFLKRYWFVSCVVLPVVVYLVLLLGNIPVGTGLYAFIKGDLEETGVFPNGHLLNGASLILTAVSLAFLPTILWMALRLRHKKVTLIVGGIFGGWAIFLGILAEFTPRRPFTLTGIPECSYFLNADGTVALRPKDLSVDLQTGKKLELATGDVIEIWRTQNPGKSVSCESPTAVTPHTPHLITIADAHTYRWFGPDGALVWYVQDSDGSYRFYDGPGRDPILDGELKPVTRDVVQEAQRIQDEHTKTVGSRVAAEAERSRALEEAEQRELKNRQAAEEREKLNQEAARRRQVNAQDAERAFAAGDFDLALIDCPDVKHDLQDDPCASVHQEAAQKKVAILVKRSEEDVRKYKLDDAIQDAAEALKLEPESESAKTALHFAQTLKRADASSNQ